MKIVHCFFTMKIGGSQILAVDLMNEMCKINDTSLIIINNQWDKVVLDRIDKNIKIYFINRSEGSKNPLPILRFNILLNKIGPDIIHCHENKIINLIKFSRAKTIYTVHAFDVLTTSLKKYDAIVSISQAVADDIKQRSGLISFVIYNGIPFGDFKKRIVYGLKPNEPIRLVQVSRLTHEIKGQDILINALNYLIKNKGVTNITLDFIGDGESQNYLESLVDLLGLKQKIKFIGPKSRDWVMSNLLGYDILVQPSRIEGFGLTIVEGIAAGLPVLVSDIKGPAEVMNGLSRDFLFKSDDAKNCAEALFNLISLYNQHEIKFIMDETYKISINKFSIKCVVDSYINEYQRLVNCHSE
jgi:glycosyltransferase involved in cell wall biosynthesis